MTSPVHPVIAIASHLVIAIASHPVIATASPLVGAIASHLVIATASPPVIATASHLVNKVNSVNTVNKVKKVNAVPSQTPSHPIPSHLFPAAKGKDKKKSKARIPPMPPQPPNPMARLSIALLLLFAAMTGRPVGVAASDSDTPLTFQGMADASTAVWLTGSLLAVAEDETNAIRIYDFVAGGGPQGRREMDAFLAIDPQRPEADIEGSTRVGDRIYWITSHGRNKDGKERPSRYRFFATDLGQTADGPTLTPVGRPCVTLAPALLRQPWVAQLGLARAVRLGEDLKKAEREALAPKEQGMNIEALAASADGQVLYIGLRNPLFDGVGGWGTLALVAVLTNADEVVEQGATPAFDNPMLWDLDRRGVRSMEYSPRHGRYFIIAGMAGGKDRFSLYDWTGRREDAPRRVVDIDDAGGDFNPEGLIAFADRDDLLLLSDDGSRLVQVDDPAQCLPGELIDGQWCPNKALVDEGEKTFHGRWLALPAE